MTALRIVLLSLSVLVLAPLATAQTVLVARADFNTDTVGELPDASLPGDPEGDVLGWAGQVTPTVADSAGTLLDQPVRISRSGGSGGGRFWLNVPPSAGPCAKFLFRFRMARTTDYIWTSVIPMAPNQGTLGIMAFHSNHILTTPDGVDLPSLGTVEKDVDVLVEWEIDRVTGIQSISLDGVLVSDQLETKWKNTLGVDFNRLSFEPGSTSAQAFAIDDIEIYAIDCATAVEIRTWGQIKSTYR
jgi:hypothetical protein